MKFRVARILGRQLPSLSDTALNHWFLRRSILLQLLLAVVSGLLLALAFAPYELSLLSWVAFVPLLYAIEGCGLLEVLALAWLQELAFCMMCGSWLFSTLHDYARLSVTRSFTEFTILGLMLAAFGAGAIAAAKFVSRRLSVPMFLTLPTSWTAGEWMRTNLPLSFPWNLLGYAAYRDIHLIQFAEFTGVYGISALIIFVNVCIYEFLFGAGTVVARRTMLVSSIGILLAVLVFGAKRVAQIDSAQPAGTLKVGLISGGLPPAKVHSSMSRAETFDLYRLNTQLTLGQHLIWLSGLNPPLWASSRQMGATRFS